MAAVTRLGLYGGPRSPYGDFSGKTAASKPYTKTFTRLGLYGGPRMPYGDFTKVAGPLSATGSPEVSPTATGTAKVPLRAAGTVLSPIIVAEGTAAGPVPSVGGGGGSWDPHRGLAGIPVRTKPLRAFAAEEEIEEAVEDAIEQAEQLESPDSKLPGQDIAHIAKQRLIKRQELVRSIRKSEKVSQRAAERLIEARINDLVRRRRDYFISEDDDIEAILFILSAVE